jgi:hypothetical protein
MPTPNANAGQVMNTIGPSSVATLSTREILTARMVRNIEAKIERLSVARDARVAALKNIRAALARSLERVPDGPESHEHTE